MPSRSSRKTSPRRTRPSAASEPLFELLPSPIQGRGAFALRELPKDTRLIEYTGERITQEEANARYDDEAMERHHTFLFSLEDDVVIDGGQGGNDSRFFNHSCEPNCKAYIEDGRIFLYTERHIWPGEELVYDYSFERAPDMTEEDERRYVCRCGSPFCRGTILVPPKEPKRTAGRKARGARRSPAARRSRKGRAR
jgi:uncharacterized protein